MTPNKNSHTVGDVTLFLHGRMNLRYYRIASAAREYMGNPPDSDTWANAIVDRFAILEGLGIAPYCQAPDGHPFAEYLARRDKLSIAERLELFETTLDIEHLNLIYTAWQNTRENVLPLELPADVNPEDDSQKKDTSFSSGEKSANGKPPQSGQIKNVTPTEPLPTAQANG